MGDRSKIEWTEATWNPVVGCSVVSPGCTNCYAMKQAGRLLDGNPKVPHYAGTTQPSKAGPVWSGKVELAPERTLLQPLSWKRPRMIFVNSMGDLFHEGVPDEWIDRVFAVMALCPEHTFQVLTKRAKRMQAYFAGIPEQPDMSEGRSALIEGSAQAIYSQMTGEDPSLWLAVHTPLPNVWLGVSAEDQQRADERIPYLLETPAAVRFVSAEPLLGPIDFFHIRENTGHTFNALSKKEGIAFRGTGLDWVIAGGESGPDARPMHPDWARSIRDQCQVAGVPFFFKQWGEWISAKCLPGHLPIGHIFDDGYQMIRIGKRLAGRLLDGREHNDMPGART